MQVPKGPQTHLQRPSPFLRSRSPYSLDFHTAVVLFHFHQDWTFEEIKSEFDKHLHPHNGPRAITIKRWLSAFSQDAPERTSFFVKQFFEHNLSAPAKTTVTEHYLVRNFPSLYFLECTCSLYCQLHPKAGNDFRFLWHANGLIRSRFGFDLFRCRSP